MKDFIKKSNKELVTLLSQKREAVRTFRFNISGSNTRNVKEGATLKKDIARILTLLNKPMSVGGESDSNKNVIKKVKTPKAN